MKSRRILAVVVSLLMIAGVLFYHITSHTAVPFAPSQSIPRTLLRVWDVSGPTGSSAWLRGQCAAFERQNAGVSVYLRQVSAEECLAEGCILPDVLVFSGGTFTAPEQLLIPLQGETRLRESYVQSGRWLGAQYALPLAAEGWVLAVDGKLSPETVATPAPTTLLGRAMPSTEAVTVTPAMLPLEALSILQTPLLARGQGLFALHTLLKGAALPLQDTALTQAEIASASRRGACGSALLTSGQYARLVARDSFSAALFLPPEALAPVVLYAGVTVDASPTAAAFLRFLTEADAQRALVKQQLFSVREDVALYPQTPWSTLERTLMTGCPVNAFWPQTRIDNAARQVYRGERPLTETLAELR